VCKVDDLHNTEDQRQSGGHQKQGHPELQAIKDLFNDK